MPINLMASLALNKKIYVYVYYLFYGCPCFWKQHPSLWTSSVLLLLMPDLSLGSRFPMANCGVWIVSHCAYAAYASSSSRNASAKQKLRLSTTDACPRFLLLLSFYFFLQLARLYYSIRLCPVIARVIYRQRRMSLISARVSNYAKHFRPPADLFSCTCMKCQHCFSRPRPCILPWL